MSEESESSELERLELAFWLLFIGKSMSSRLSDEDMWLIIRYLGLKIKEMDAPFLHFWKNYDC
jgi:hypothetical protein